jgi:hypothetical protein
MATVEESSGSIAPENTMWKKNWNGSMENDCDLNAITGPGEAKEMPNPFT